MKNGSIETREAEKLSRLLVETRLKQLHICMHRTHDHINNFAEKCIVIENYLVPEKSRDGSRN